MSRDVFLLDGLLQIVFCKSAITWDHFGNALAGEAWFIHGCGSLIWEVEKLHQIKGADCEVCPFDLVLFHCLETHLILNVGTVFV